MFLCIKGIRLGSILSPLIFDVVTEEVAREGRALMYAADLVLICERKEAVQWLLILQSREQRKKEI